MFIYKITNKINGKIYIGQTIKSINTRWSNHNSDSKTKNTYLCKSIRKYGKENFNIEEIDGANSQSELNYKEWLYVYKFNSLAPNGYNLMEGGGAAGKRTEEFKSKMSKVNKGKIRSVEFKQNVSRFHKDKKVSQETREKLREASTGRKHSEETKAKMSKSQKGKITSEEAKAKLSKAGIGRVQSYETRRKCSINNKGKGVKSVIRDDGVVFNSVSGAAKEISADPSAISKVLKGKNQTCKGHRFQYV